MLVSNNSDVPVYLEWIPSASGLNAVIEAPQQLNIPAHRSVSVQLRGKKGETVISQTGKLTYRVTNFLVAPEKGLDVALPVEIVYQKNP